MFYEPNGMLELNLDHFITDENNDSLLLICYICSWQEWVALHLKRCLFSIKLDREKQQFF